MVSVRRLAELLRRLADRIDPRGATAVRLRALEEILEARDELEQAMYDSDLSASWPTRSQDLEAAYWERYGDDGSGASR